MDKTRCLGVNSAVSEITRKVAGRRLRCLRLHEVSPLSREGCNSWILIHSHSKQVSNEHVSIDDIVLTCRSTVWTTVTMEGGGPRSLHSGKVATEGAWMRFFPSCPGNGYVAVTWCGCPKEASPEQVSADPASGGPALGNKHRRESLSASSHLPTFPRPAGRRDTAWSRHSQSRREVCEATCPWIDVAAGL
ncbi:hypothetical protein ASPZODRAFT_1613845 [Penicilliopsis zonata CBS 506.65]|uniref:Uncharacterized protein n=1 Tax=Penicilliopsis zonata CBS 506.65 TaxID=1073090 RepID=A0A1L9SMN0_9EURO|nr:hypothetical protein ASPZODRAFT_1613845 [Penicilliopsis zonata CBS 506.65]OJJ48519.1 hypothetical protein ASPZODRAFT_1613845 [Penicilliopsis zonata CBS 506.65]